MAIGAQEMDILVQFLVEAIVLSLLGGIAGLVVSGTMITLTSLALGWTMRIEPTSLFVALGTSMTIGLVFGFFPARRAAQLDPIQALRRE
jgi:putative ABC transport system permease protein